MGKCQGTLLAQIGLRLAAVYIEGHGEVSGLGQLAQREAPFWLAAF